MSLELMIEKFKESIVTNKRAGITIIKPLFLSINILAIHTLREFSHARSFTTKGINPIDFIIHVSDKEQKVLAITFPDIDGEGMTIYLLPDKPVLGTNEFNNSRNNVFLHFLAIIQPEIDGKP